MQDTWIFDGECAIRKYRNQSVESVYYNIPYVQRKEDDQKQKWMNKLDNFFLKTWNENKKERSAQNDM